MITGPRVGSQLGPQKAAITWLAVLSLRRRVALMAGENFSPVTVNPFWFRFASKNVWTEETLMYVPYAQVHGHKLHFQRKLHARHEFRRLLAVAVRTL